MHTGKGQVTELLLEAGRQHLRVSCPPNLVPAPGQFLLAGGGRDVTMTPPGYSPLPVLLFYTEAASQGFVCFPPVAVSWEPGAELYLRGPLGRAFALPFSARKVGLIALDGSPARLKGLIGPSLKQEAAVVLVSDSNPGSLPDDIEVQPLRALQEIIEWADYVAVDVARENLPQLRELMATASQSRPIRGAQVLVYTPMPCGGVAECGVCAVTSKSGWKLACKDGPVFDWHEIA